MWPDEWMRRGRESAMRRCHRRARREQGARQHWRKGRACCGPPPVLPGDREECSRVELGVKAGKETSQIETRGLDHADNPSRSGATQRNINNSPSYRVFGDAEFTKWLRLRRQEVSASSPSPRRTSPRLLTHGQSIVSPSARAPSVFNPQRPPGKTRWTRPVPAPMLRGALLCVLVCGSVAFSTTPHPLVRPHLPRHAATPPHRPASAMQQFATAAASARTSPQAVVDALRAPLTPIDRVESGLLAGDCAKLSGTVPWGRSSRPRVSRKNRATCFMRMNERAERLHALTELALITEFCRLGNVSDDGLLARLKHRFPDEYAKYGAENFNETTTVVEARAEAKCLSRPYRGSGPFGVIRRCLLWAVRLLDACFQIVSFGCKAVIQALEPDTRV